MLSEQKVLDCLAMEMQVNTKLFPLRNGVSYQRLMIFMYLVQGVYLSMYHKPFFNDAIVHGKNEPYCQKIIKKKGKHPTVTDLVNESQLVINGANVLKNNKACLVIRSVFNAYNALDTPTLLSMVKTQEPWQNTKTGEVISNNKLISYFDKTIEYTN